MTGNSKLLLGFAAGIAAGIGVYAFLRTEKGQKVVQQLRKKADDLKVDMDALAEKGKKMADDLKNKYAATN